MAEDRTPPPPRPIEPPSNNVFQFAATKYSNCTFSIIDHPPYPPLNSKKYSRGARKYSKGWENIAKKPGMATIYFLRALNYFQETIKYFRGTRLRSFDCSHQPFCAPPLQWPSVRTSTPPLELLEGEKYSWVTRKYFKKYRFDSSYQMVTREVRCR